MKPVVAVVVAFLVGLVAGNIRPPTNPVESPPPDLLTVGSKVVIYQQTGAFPDESGAIVDGHEGPIMLPIVKRHELVVADRTAIPTNASRWIISTGGTDKPADCWLVEQAPKGD